MHPALIFLLFQLSLKGQNTITPLCHTVQYISHSAHFSQRKDAVLCWGIWHHDKYALEEEGEGWEEEGFTVRAQIE